MDIRKLTYQINGAIFEVHKTLGSGFLEKVYENALFIELERCGLKATSQVAVDVYYKGHVVGEYLADIMIEDTVVLELKTVDPTHSPNPPNPTQNPSWTPCPTIMPWPGPLPNTTLTWPTGPRPRSSIWSGALLTYERK